MSNQTILLKAIVLVVLRFPVNADTRKTTVGIKTHSNMRHGSSCILQLIQVTFKHVLGIGTHASAHDEWKPCRFIL